MNILGLNAYHGDSSACLIQDGRIVAAAEEERFRRVKHWAGFPRDAISYCLEEGGLQLSDIDIVAVNSDPSASFFRKVAFTLRHRPHPSLLLDRLRNQSKRQSIEHEFTIAFEGAAFKGSIVRVEHHLAHIASAFLVSPFAEACAVSIDGFGDFSSTAWGVGRDSNITIDGRIHFPHSLGIFYQALTQYLGFPHYGDEYKVMGLAPYGKPVHLDAMRRIVKLTNDGKFALDLRFFRHSREKVEYTWEGGVPHVGSLYSSDLVELLGPARQPHEPLDSRHWDIARSVQAMYEEAFFHLINCLHEKSRLTDLVLAGGCAMNSVANGKVIRNSPFRNLYIQSAAGDAGGAIGAGLYAHYQNHPNADQSTKLPMVASTLRASGPQSRLVMDHAYLGPSASEAEITDLLTQHTERLQSANCRIENIGDEVRLCNIAAGAVANGEVIGWFQGRMEWGPRALGNRSIICDPRRSDMKEILNVRIKRREGFRPFAPSVLQEHVHDWFEEDGDVPFMMQVYQIREEKRPQIPAVTHVDGSGRLQTVYKATNVRYWALINAFYRITGVPMVLNTSFNENEPVVCRPSEALDCFLRTSMDVLVLGNWIIRREVRLGLSP